MKKINSRCFAFIYATLFIILPFPAQSASTHSPVKLEMTLLQAITSCDFSEAMETKKLTAEPLEALPGDCVLYALTAENKSSHGRALFNLTIDGMIDEHVELMPSYDNSLAYYDYKAFQVQASTSNGNINRENSFRIEAEADKIKFHIDFLNFKDQVTLYYLVMVK